MRYSVRMSVQRSYEKGSGFFRRKKQAEALSSMESEGMKSQSVGSVGREEERVGFGMTCRERHSHQQACCVLKTMRSLFIQSFNLIINVVNK